MIRPVTSKISDHILSLPKFEGHAFKNGTQVDRIALSCEGCNAEISDVHVKLDAFEHSLAATAYAICYECKLITPAHLRFSDDGTYLAGDEKGNWTNGSFMVKKNGWVQKLKSGLIWMIAFGDKK